jgi:type II secretory pathway pseudopilin PulG
MFFIAASGVALASITEIWTTDRQRQREAELLRVGAAFRDAIALYYERTPGAVKRYPPTLEDLIEDRRYLSLQRYLRKIYLDRG